MGWSAVVREVWVASLVGRPRGGGGRFRLPWLGGVGCSWGSVLCVVVLYVCYPMYTQWRVCMFVRWCVYERVESKICIILIQSKIFECKNLTAIYLHAAR